MESRDFGSPDETRTPDKTTVDVVRLGETTAARLQLEPGWRWSDCVKPVVGGERCQAHHVGLLQSGTMHVAHDDGTEQEIHAGQAYVIEPGHYAWVVGDEPVVGFEFESRTAEVRERLRHHSAQNLEKFDLTTVRRTRPGLLRQRASKKASRPRSRSAT